MREAADEAARGEADEAAPGRRQAAGHGVGAERQHGQAGAALTAGRRLAAGQGAEDREKHRAVSANAETDRRGPTHEDRPTGRRRGPLLSGDRCDLGEIGCVDGRHRAGGADFV